jgi:hypothetical protein
VSKKNHSENTTQSFFPLLNMDQNHIQSPIDQEMKEEKHGEEQNICYGPAIQTYHCSRSCCDNGKFRTLERICGSKYIPNEQLVTFITNFAQTKPLLLVNILVTGSPYCSYHGEVQTIAKYTFNLEHFIQINLQDDHDNILLQLPLHLGNAKNNKNYDIILKKNLVCNQEKLVYFLERSLNDSKTWNKNFNFTNLRTTVRLHHGVEASDSSTHSGQYSVLHLFQDPTYQSWKQNFWSTWHHLSHCNQDSWVCYCCAMCDGQGLLNDYISFQCCTWVPKKHVTIPTFTYTLNKREEDIVEWMLKRLSKVKPNKRVSGGLLV